MHPFGSISKRKLNRSAWLFLGSCCLCSFQAQRVSRFRHVFVPSHSRREPFLNKHFWRVFQAFTSSRLRFHLDICHSEDPKHLYWSWALLIRLFRLCGNVVRTTPPKNLITVIFSHGSHAVSDFPEAHFSKMSMCRQIKGFYTSHSVYPGSSSSYNNSNVELLSPCMV